MKTVLIIINPLTPKLSKLVIDCIYSLEKLTWKNYDEFFQRLWKLSTFTL